MGINPGLWTAAVNAPFAHPGNRFWPSLHPAELNASELRSGAERIRSLGADDHFVGFGMALTSWSAQQA
nr:hypothetical protein [uncultured Tessaracoccus sp.]